MEEIPQDEQLKKINPIDRSNVISRAFFCWMLPYFVKGFKRELTEDDMYRHREQHNSGMLGDKLENAWNRQLKTKQNPSLFLALCDVFALEFLLLSTAAVFSEIVRIIQPLYIAKLLTYYDENRVEENVQSTYYCAVMIVLMSLVHIFLIQFFNFNTMQIGMKMRIAACSLIYRKSLKLSKTALAETTVGQMVNLISNDVSRFDYATHFMYHLVIAPTETLIVMYLCYQYVGWTGLAGTIFLLLAVPLQSYLGKKTSQFRLGVALRTDERVRLMNEIVTGIQVIKMYTWEKPFSKLVEVVRMKEMKFVKYTSIIRAIMMSCAIVFNRTAIFLCILTYVLTGNKLASSYVYTMTSFYRLLYTVTMFFPQAITQVAEMLVSIKRIKQFLYYEELVADTSKSKNIFNGTTPNLITDTKPILPTEVVGVNLKNVSTKWLKSLPDNNLENITLDVQSGELVAIVGSVGSGKSTLLHVILRELLPLEGCLNISGTITYASQEPWLFGGSVRQNILFGQQYDEAKYREVIRVCALERDFSLLAHGDRTLASERGVTLSGGQRARISLARAIYKEADIYLLDDPLSAVDAHVGKQLFDECICGYLKNKCVILVTHQLQYLKKIKRIVLLNEGKIVVSGSYEDLKNTSSHYSRMLADIEDEEGESKRKSRMIIANETDDDKRQIQSLAREEKGIGNITWHVYKSYILAGGHWSRAFALGILFLLSQFLDSTTEYFVTFWVNIEQSNLSNTKLNSFEGNETNSNRTSYLETGNNIWLQKIFIGDYTVVYYSILFAAMAIVVFSRSILLYRWSNAAATRMHNTMFTNIVYSPMRFFHINPTGRILNRFSKDIGAVDETLPMTILDTVQIGLIAISVCLVIGSITPWILIPTLFIFILFYLMRVVFLETSRDIKRVESVTRSPIYTHISASLQGLTTIRAFKAQEILRTEFDNYQNLHSAAFFMFLGANRTFGFWLDFICCIYTALVMLFLLFINKETMGGRVGLGVTQAITLTGMLQWGMRQWSELENQMTSVERVQEYADLKHEEEGNIKEIAESWPKYGKIEFKNLSLRYSKDNPPVLKNLSFLIQPKEKIGIVGRTGAGKSSLIQALFRLTGIDGAILIDGVDTKTVSLNKLRSKMSIIPQEPVLFSSTLRKNLDPFDEYKDDILWNALQEVELKSAIEDLPVGLDSKMAEGGSNFSVGQRQLVCLARAIVRNNKILVLDEATANIDPHTDELIQKTIRVKFANCTVLTIAHRLHTIMDSDKVLVMDAGQLVEFDHPHLLLQNDMGVFCSLLKQTGKSTSKTLQAVAEQAYNNKYQINQ